MPSIPERVATRHIEWTAMAVLLRNVADHDWGFFSREDQRMHLQTVEDGARTGSKNVKVWLENRGKRIFERATGKLAGKGLETLERKVNAERPVLESRWVTFMIRNDWLTAKLVGSILTLTAYPRSHNSFTRDIDLRRLYPGAYRGNEASWNVHPPLIDFDDTTGLLAIGPEKTLDAREHIDPSEYLFVD